MSAEFIERRTREWVDAFVVDGARVCPFASRAKLRVRVCEDASEAGACEAVVREAAALAATASDAVFTVTTDYRWWFWQFGTHLSTGLPSSSPS